MSYLGIDIGTSGVKAGVFDAEGNLLALARREYPLLHPQPCWAEIDSSGVCKACLDAIREAAGSCPQDPVRALGITSQGEAFTPVAADGHILGNGMVSSDARAADLVLELSHRIGPEKLYEITGHTSHPMFTLFKLAWVRKHLGETWRDAAHFYCFEDLLQSRLGLVPAISWPLAGRTMLFNVRSHQWDDDILSELDLSPDRLARPLASGQVAGEIPRDIAARLSLPADVLVVAGGHDQPCGALGAGVIEPGVAMYATGTVECICPAFEEPVFDSRLFNSNLCTYDYTLPDMYTTILFSLTGGNLLQWYRNQFGRWEVEEAGRTGGDAYSLLLRNMAEDPTDLLVLPYFTPSGTPYFDAATPGAIVGLRLTHTRGQLLRGLMEGVALEMRLNVDILEQAGLRIDRFLAIGGGARSLELTQLKADVMGRPITTLAVTEAGCLGVALLACAAHTGVNARDLVGTWVRPIDQVDPDARRAAIYHERLAVHRQLYPAIRELHGKTTHEPQ